jgi:hypothetical protein
VTAVGSVSTTTSLNPPIKGKCYTLVNLFRKPSVHIAHIILPKSLHLCIPTVQPSQPAAVLCLNDRAHLDSVFAVACLASWPSLLTSVLSFAVYFFAASSKHALVSSRRIAVSCPSLSLVVRSEAVLLLVVLGLEVLLLLLLLLFDMVL